MGVGLYSVSCGYGCGCGFGGFASLIAMVLALRAREARTRGEATATVFPLDFRAFVNRLRQLWKTAIFSCCVRVQKVRFTLTGMHEMRF